MERTTILLPARLKKLASRHAAKEHISLPVFIRTLLEQQWRERALAKASMFFADTELYTGEASSDLAENHNDYLCGKINDFYRYWCFLARYGQAAPYSRRRLSGPLETQPCMTSHHVLDETFTSLTSCTS